MWEVYMKLKNKLISAVLSAVLLTSSVGATAAFTDVTAAAATTAKKLPAPTEIKVNKTAKTITLTWNKVEGADAYRVYKYNSTTKKYVKYKDVTKTTCKITGLSPSKTYKFKIVSLAYAEHKSSGAISAKTMSTGDEIILNGSVIQLPVLSQTVDTYTRANSEQEWGLSGSCDVRAMDCKVKDDKLVLYFTGEKTYAYSMFSMGVIGWKMYEVGEKSDKEIAKGDCYPSTAYATERFTNSSYSIDYCLEKGKTYRIELVDAYVLSPRR